MVGADHLRIVFRVDGTGFVMPVVNLLAIRGPGEDQLSLNDVSAETLLLGSLTYRETDVAIYDLAALFELEAGSVDTQQLLIFAGADGPWAVPVAHVEGVIDASHLAFYDLPAYMLRDGVSLYRQAAIYENRLLVSADVHELDIAWGGRE